MWLVNNKNYGTITPPMVQQWRTAHFFYDICGTRHDTLVYTDGKTYLSKLERGKLLPTLPTLRRIAMVFSVGLNYFFTDERKRHVVAVTRKKERLRFAEKMGRAEAAYQFESLDFRANQRKFSAFLASFGARPPERVKLHQHGGVEFLYVLGGKLDLTIG